MAKTKYRVWDARNLVFSDNLFFVDIYGNLSVYFNSKSSNLCRLDERGSEAYKATENTGFDDKHGVPIFVGDILEVPGGTKITVTNLSDFLLYCGRYEEKHGVPLFGSVIVVGNVFEN